MRASSRSCKENTFEPLAVSAQHAVQGNSRATVHEAGLQVKGVAGLERSDVGCIRSLCNAMVSIDLRHAKLILYRCSVKEVALATVGQASRAVLLQSWQSLTNIFAHAP